MPHDEQTCLTPECLTARKVNEATLLTKLNGVITLCIAAVGLLSYSVFFQAPDMRAETQDLKHKVETLDQRVCKLEGK